MITKLTSILRRVFLVSIALLVRGVGWCLSHWLRAHKQATRTSRSPRPGGTAEPTRRGTTGDRGTDRRGGGVGGEGESAWRRRSPALGTRFLAIIARTIVYARAEATPERSRRSGRAAGESADPGVGITPAVSPRRGHSAPGSPGTRDAGRPALPATPPPLRRP